MATFALIDCMGCQLARLNNSMLIRALARFRAYRAGKISLWAIIFLDRIAFRREIRRRAEATAEEEWQATVDKLGAMFWSKP